MKTGLWIILVTGIVMVFSSVPPIYAYAEFEVDVPDNWDEMDNDDKKDFFYACLLKKENFKRKNHFYLINEYFSANQMILHHHNILGTAK